MRKITLAVFFTVAFFIFSQYVFAEEPGFHVKHDSGGIPSLRDIHLVLPNEWGDLSFFGRDRFRYEAWDYFRSASDNHYDFFTNQLRLGAKWANEYFNGNITWQYTQMHDLPTHTSTGAGSGALYFSNSLHRDSHGEFIKYLNIEIKDIWSLGLTETLGRFSYSSGNEMKSDDKKIDWLKSQRISERLIGGFEYSHYGRSFDGAKAVYADDRAQVEVAGFSPTQGGFEEMAQRDISNIKIITVEANIKKDKWIPGMEENFFYYGYDDHRVIAAQTTRFDNTGRRINAGDESDIEIHTFGGHLVGSYKIGPGMWDILGWGAVQTGSWYELNQRSYAFAAETGYQMNDWAWKPWLRIGINYGSGDNDPSDSRHQTFFQMLPTSRFYSSSILYNMMNSTDWFVSLILKPADNFTVRPEYHHLDLSQTSDRWYLGSGAMHNNIADDFSTRSSNTASNLGQLVDLSISVTVNPNITANVYYGHFFGGDVVRDFYSKRQTVDMGYAELIVNF